jgi:hypothetical protein
VAIAIPDCSLHKVAGEQSLHFAPAIQKSTQATFDLDREENFNMIATHRHSH